MACTLLSVRCQSELMPESHYTFSYGPQNRWDQAKSCPSLVCIADPFQRFSTFVWFPFRGGQVWQKWSPISFFENRWTYWTIPYSPIHGLPDMPWHVTSSLNPMCIPQSSMTFFPPMLSKIQLLPTSWPAPIKIATTYSLCLIRDQKYTSY